MNRIKVNLGKKISASYEIYIGQNILDRMGLIIAKNNWASRYIMVTDSTVSASHGELVQAALREMELEVDMIDFPAGETSKNFETSLHIIDRMIDLGADRTSALIALGGGVVGDMSGFIASIYMRGIPYIQVPTTQLAQVDSSLGGKTAVNHPKGKNLIGSFHQPSLVVSDPSVLLTLPREELLSGMGEVVKHGVIADAALFKFIEDKASSLVEAGPSALVHVVERSVAIKGGLVSVDERDNKGIRAILNYGHTTGHALETLSEHELRHGEAVALGMIVASRLSNNLGLITIQDIERQMRLLEAIGFRLTPPKLCSTEIVEIMHRDKKAVGESIRFVLPTGIGRTPVLRPVSERLIIQSLEDEGYG